MANEPVILNVYDMVRQSPPRPDHTHFSVNFRCSTVALGVCKVTPAEEVTAPVCAVLKVDIA